jgi:hypothetical protein
MLESDGWEIVLARAWRIAVQRPESVRRAASARVPRLRDGAYLPTLTMSNVTCAKMPYPRRSRIRGR